MPLPRRSPVHARPAWGAALGALLAVGGALAVPAPASAFTLVPGDGPVVSSPGSLTPGSPTGAFAVSAHIVDRAVPSPAGHRGPNLQQSLQDAQDAVDGFWRRHWTRVLGGRYDPPAVLGPYDGSNPATTPRCGGHPLLRDNAAYCPEGDYLAWDEHLIRDGLGSGDAWIYMVIAHEWGHAVQRRMPPALVSGRTELQADCLAGAALRGAARDGALLVDPDDQTEIDAAFRQIGDGTPWTRPGDHGTAAQRIAEFTRG
ncbi:hypothetical protein AB0J52_27055, partial [Spirillospora sp. NPDC049652]